MRKAPRPPKGLNIKYCAILQKEMFEAYSCALIVKARGKRSPQTIPCSANRIGLSYTGFQRAEWKKNYRMQALY